MARREYKTRCKFFRDDDTEVEIQWYRAAPDAPPLGRSTAFMSLDWLESAPDQPWYPNPGEVYGAERPYSFKGELISPTYDHVCGTDEDFRLGAVFDPDRDVQYDEQGLPLCCGQPATPFLGLVIGFELPDPDDVIGTPFCFDAPLLPFGVVGTGTVQPFVECWFKIPVTAGTTYRATFTGVTQSFDFIPWEGATCGSAVAGMTRAIAGPTDTEDFTATTNTWVFLNCRAHPFWVTPTPINVSVVPL